MTNSASSENQSSSNESSENRKNNIPSVSVRIEDLSKRFQGLRSWEDRYRQILFYGKKLPPMPADLKTDDLLVPGCVSKVWLHWKRTENPEYPQNSDSNIHEMNQGDSDTLHFTADSDGAITKGIIALLVHVYQDAPVSEIKAHPPDFLTQLGIQEHLSMNRRNGLVNMMAMIKKACQ